MAGARPLRGLGWVRDRVAVGRDRPSQALLEWHLGLESKALSGSRDVEISDGLSVRSGCVPDRFAVEAGKPFDHCGQVTDARFGARPDVDWLGRVVTLRRQHE